MDRGHRIAALVCGRRTKWLVLAFCLIVLVVLGPLAGKLTGAEKNDNSSWLPGGAESTAVINLQSKFQAHDTAYAIVVYERKSGITSQDQAKVAGDAQAFAGINGVDAKVVGPLPSDKDDQALQVLVPITVGDGGWDELGKDVQKIKDIATPALDGMTVH